MVVTGAQESVVVLLFGSLNGDGINLPNISGFYRFLAVPDVGQKKYSIPILLEILK